MKFLNTLKKFFGIDEEEYITQNQSRLERELADAKRVAAEYKKLALIKNQESVRKDRVIDQLKTQIQRLEGINQCQSELLAERKY